MSRILVTGSSGFIGTNLVELLITAGHEVLGVDIQEPQIREHASLFRRVDILDEPSLTRVCDEFAPTEVVHLAARTDLHESRSLSGYATNTEGVTNMLACISRQSSVRRSIFASTKLVCPTDYCPTSDDDYCPTTRYGESKMLGEKIVKSATSLHGEWCIVRPTSIWGPWSNFPHIPYCRFFRMIARGRYWHPGRASPPRSFGYVGNAVFQVRKLLEAPAERIHRKVFYISDYEVFTIREWADMISMKLHNRRLWTMPEPLVRMAAWAGDLMKMCGVNEPPMSSFRLRNMRVCTAGTPLTPIKQITGPLPYTLEQGVEATIKWLREAGLVG
jgi:nucleoside-diphosphate-sugar epimerase